MTPIQGLLTFMGIGLGSAVLYGAYVFIREKKSPVEHFKSDAGRGAAGSALKAIGILFLVGVVMVLASCADTTYLNDAGAYAGIDHTKNQSPQCKADGIDSHGTSNLGFWVNVAESGPVRTNLRYTHHSCYLGSDRNSYDGVGVQVEYKFWERK